MQVGDLVCSRIESVPWGAGIVLKLRKRHARILWTGGKQEWYDRALLEVISASR